MQINSGQQPVHRFAEQNCGTVLEFSKKYDADYALRYLKKHQDGFWRRLSDWREHQIARKALRIAGNPREVLDMPCGAGRFWDVLTEDPHRIIYAGDFNQSMIDTGVANHHSAITDRIRFFQSSAFDLPVPDNFVDSISPSASFIILVRLRTD